MRVSRRQVITQVAAVAMTNKTVRAVAQLAAPGVPHDDEGFWKAFRNQFRLDQRLLLFNNVGLSASPATVIDALTLEQKRANQDPSYYVYRLQRQEIEPLRNRLASLVGCAREEIAITPNATYGLHVGIMGIDLPAGAVVAASSHEYPRALAAIEQKSARSKTVHRAADVPARPMNAEALWHTLEPSLSNAALGVFSTVSYLNGTILPSPRISREVAKGGGTTLLDAAQSIGILPLNFREAGYDMLTACLHKWMMAPVGTGIFCVRKDLIHRIWSLHPSEAYLERDILKFEHWGTRPFAPVLAIREALDLHELIGLDRKAKRLNYLRRYLWERLDALPGVSLSGSIEVACGIGSIAIEVKGHTGAAMAGELLTKYQIHVTSFARAGINAIRISPHLFTTLPECDRLIAAVRTIAKSE